MVTKKVNLNVLFGFFEKSAFFAGFSAFSVRQKQRLNIYSDKLLIANPNYFLKVC